LIGENTVATYIVIRRVTLYVIAFVAMHTSLHAQKRWEAPRIVSTNCSGCHGIDGNAELAYFPRLAGLDAAYMKKKVGEFNESPPTRGG
jgi:cytochrome c553